VSAPIVPVFDPESPDALILEAFEKVRAYRAHFNSLDLATLDAEQEKELERAGDAAIVEEDRVYGDVANTIPGVAARLQLLVTALDCERWVDRCFAQHGFLALYHEIKHLDGHAQQAAYAVHELIDIEWQQNLAAYEKSAADFSLAVDLRGVVDVEEIRLRQISLEPDDFARAVAELAAKFEDHFSNGDTIARLVRTLAPDHAAYLRKVEIIIAESFQEDATPWLARDTLYLSGRIEREAE
jgi:murein L,D-transpeptidase YcbB/YkuD